MFGADAVRCMRRNSGGGGGGGIPTDGLFVWYTMDNISGNTLVDEMGNYNGTIDGATSVLSEAGPALSFDGVNDSVFVGDTGTPAKCIAGIVKMLNIPGSTTDRSIICGYQDGVDPRYNLLVSAYNYDKFITYFTRQNGPRYQGIYRGVPEGYFTFFLIFDNGESALYINNVLVIHDVGSTGDLGGDYNDFIIGKDIINIRYGEMILPELALYNTIPTPSDRVDLHNWLTRNL